MQQEQRIAEPAPPQPIEGRVVQVIVEYIGEKRGGFTIRGPSSGREYRFDAGPWHRRNYVLAEDLERFEGSPDFRILPDTLIDPEAEEREQRERDLAELRQKLVELEQEQAQIIPAVVKVVKEHVPAKRSRRASGKAPGRSPGKGLGALLDCWMTCGGLEDQFDIVREAYDAIGRYLAAHPRHDVYLGLRERFPSMRSDAKRKREKAGGACQWHNHQEEIPPELLHQ